MENWLIAFRFSFVLWCDSFYSPNRFGAKFFVTESSLIRSVVTMAYKKENPRPSYTSHIQQTLAKGTHSRVLFVRPSVIRQPFHPTCPISHKVVIFSLTWQANTERKWLIPWGEKLEARQSLEKEETTKSCRIIIFAVAFKGAQETTKPSARVVRALLQGVKRPKH